MLSDGSACNTGAIEPSHVLKVMGLSREQTGNAIRISLGRITKEEDIDEIARNPFWVKSSQG